MRRSHSLWHPIVLHCVFLPFRKNLPSTSYHVHRLPNEWVVSPQPWGSTESSHYHSPALLWHGIVFVHFGCSIGGRIYFDGSSLLLYLLRDLNHSLLPLHSLPVGYTVFSHALCINILKIYRCFVLFILLDTYNQNFTLRYWINLVLLEKKTTLQ